MPARKRAEWTDLYVYKTCRGITKLFTVMSQCKVRIVKDSNEAAQNVEMQKIVSSFPHLQNFSLILVDFPLSFFFALSSLSICAAAFTRDALSVLCIVVSLRKQMDSLQFPQSYHNHSLSFFPSYSLSCKLQCAVCRLWEAY